VYYESSNKAVARIENGLIQLTGVGTASITAYQEGGGTYSAATPVSQQLTVLSRLVLSNGTGGGLWSATTTWALGVVPELTADVRVIGSDAITISGAASCNSLTIAAASSLNVNSNSTLMVTNAISNDGSLTVENNANLIQSGTTNVNIGNITVKRDSNALMLLDYTLWSSPVSGQQLQSFSSATLANRFYTYNPAKDQYKTATATDNFTTGAGYLIRMPNNHPTVPTFWTGSFTGIPNNGTITLNDLTSSKYYAIGNPYPSTISADAFLDGNDTAGTMYFWRKTNGVLGTAYATYTRAGGIGTDAGIGAVGAPDGTIQVGQGFIVQTGTAATSLTFTNAMRTTESGSQFFKTKGATDKSRVWLSLIDAKSSLNQTMIAYMDGATLGVDAGYDGKYINDSKIALTSSIEGQEYIIQARHTFDASDVVALNFKTDVAGDYSIALDKFDGLFDNGYDVYLVDALTGKETNLKTTAYSFTAAAGVDNSRFSLKYQKTASGDTPDFNENSVTVHKNNGAIYVNSTAKDIKNIEVYDVRGRLLAKQMDVKANIAFVNVKFAKQLLIVKVNVEGNNTVSKKVLY
jgi:trimeric autotransporter adhesin